LHGYRRYLPNHKNNNRHGNLHSFFKTQQKGESPIPSAYLKIKLAFSYFPISVLEINHAVKSSSKMFTLIVNHFTIGEKIPYNFIAPLLYIYIIYIPAIEL
jgi:hypothetical protein